MKKLELKWETTQQPSLTCNGCRRVLSDVLSISTPSDISPVVWLRLCRDCLKQVCNYIDTQEQSDDEWLRANGFVQTVCWGCGDPLVLVSTEYYKYAVYKCDECSKLSEKELYIRRQASGRATQG